MFSAIVNIVLGLGMAIAGFTDNAVLIGTNSGVALAAFGVAIAGYGVFQIYRLRFRERPPTNS